MPEERWALEVGHGNRNAKSRCWMLVEGGGELTSRAARCPTKPFLSPRANPSSSRPSPLMCEWDATRCSREVVWALDTARGRGRRRDEFRWLMRRSGESTCCFAYGSSWTSVAGPFNQRGRLLLGFRALLARWVEKVSLCERGEEGRGGAGGFGSSLFRLNGSGSTSSSSVELFA
jgi:hypothetical protein